MNKPIDEHAWSERRSSGPGQRGASDPRSPFDIDYGRIVHSAAFRRLQGKTQILGIGAIDFPRTRLTHSLEAAQVGRGLLKVLHAKYNNDAAKQTWLPPQELLETICLGHDLGHPPFGHGGELALNYHMRDAGGYEGNAQTLRIVTELESRHEGFGLDLSRRTLLGLIKYPGLWNQLNHAQTEASPPIRWEHWHPPKALYDEQKPLLDWMLAPFTYEEQQLFIESSSKPTSHGHKRTLHKSLDASLMEICDDVAYGIHDLEDAIVLGMITRDAWCRAIEPNTDIASRLTELTEQLFSRSGHLRKQAIGGLVHQCLMSVSLTHVEGFTHPLLNLRAQLAPLEKNLLEWLKGVVFSEVISSQQVRTFRFRGCTMLSQVFKAMVSQEGNLLSTRFSERWQNADTSIERCRVVSDYLSGMTDEHLTRVYERLFVPGRGGLFDKL